jgi:hypothetical protein
MKDNLNLQMPFYKKRRVNFSNYSCTKSGGISFNLYEYVGYYYLTNKLDTTAHVEQRINELVWQDVTKDNVYYEPLIFDSRKALMCNLLPYRWYGDKLLATGFCEIEGENITKPRLDAYEALTRNTISQDSLIFSNHRHFKKVIGKELTKEIMRLVIKNQDLILKAGTQAHIDL